jgi:RecA/RadA recombinase
MSEKNIIDSLRKFGNEFQSKCISSLVADKAFLERIFDILDPKYFDTDANVWITSEIISYFIQYKDIPTMVAFKVKVDAIESETLKMSVINQLRVIYQRISDSDIKFVQETFLEFCRNQKLKTAIMDSVEHLRSGEYEKIKHLVDEALKAGMERNLGHIYIDDVDKRMSEMARNTIKTGWSLIDDLIDGGLGKGELGFIVAPAGSGKSWLLARLGAEAMRQGKNVAHFTMELNENYVGLRYDACFTGIPFQEIKQHVSVIKDKISSIPGKLYIKYFPIKTVSANSLKMHIDRLQMLTGVKIDMIVVDYADLLVPMMAVKNANSYSESGSVYEELRAVAGELQIPVWSASQSNRGAHEEEVIQAHNVADSYRKIMTGDVVLSLSRRMEDKQASTARIHIIKNRFGADGITFPALFNSSNGDIRVFDPSSKEGVELQEKMNDGENMVKNMLKDKWNNHTENKSEDSD